MSLLHRPPLPLETTDADALTREARGLRRRRWALRTATVVLVAGVGIPASALAGGFSGGNRGSTSQGKASPRPPTLGKARTVSLRTALLTGPVPYDELSVVNGKLVVYGSARTSNCTEAVVSPKTLRITKTKAFNCSLWPPDHETYVVQQPIPNSTSNDVELRLERINSRNARITTGPVVLTTANSSDTHYEAVYGGGALWIYACQTPSGAQLLQVSDTTGAVQSKVAMPSICEGVIAAGIGGFWLAPSPPSGWKGPGVYHVAPGMKSPELVERTDNAAAWIVVADGDAWIDQFTPPNPACGGCQTGELLRFDGSDTTPAFRVSDRGLFDHAEMSAYPAAVGNLTAGIWTYIEVGAKSSSVTNGRDEIVRIDASTGHWSGMARLTPTNADPAYALSLAENEGSIFDGSFFSLEPAFYKGDKNVIVRVSAAN